jgi:hypothetical protein
VKGDQAQNVYACQSAVLPVHSLAGHPVSCFELPLCISQCGLPACHRTGLACTSFRMVGCQHPASAIYRAQKYRDAAMVELEALNTIAANDPTQERHCVQVGGAPCRGIGPFLDITCQHVV